ncbi:hypothetical protein, partial [Bacillus cereus group sp. BC241]
IILNQGLLKETKPLQLALRELAGHNVHFHVSPTGTRGQYLKLSNTNALSAMTSKLNHKMTIQQRVNELQRVLGIDNVTRMECFDI